MTRHTHEGKTVRPADIELGGEGDMPGLSQERTVDDIDDLAFDTSISVRSRREQLTLLLQETNWHKLEKHRFAKQIADVLYTAAHRGDYSQLVLAAPPMIMGDLRKAMHKEVSDKVVAEISKDLTNMPADAIEKALTANGSDTR